MVRGKIALHVLVGVLVVGSAYALIPPDLDDLTARPNGFVAGGGSGSCCDQGTETCQDGVAEVDCSGVGQVWSGSRPCCEVECRSVGAPEFDSQGVALLSRVTMADFRDFLLDLSEPHTGNENWGYVSPLGRQYAIIGFTTGVGIVEITDPMDPTIIAYVGGEGIDTVWRDMAIYREYLYIVTDGGGVGLQIVDLSEIDSGTVTHVATTNLGHGFFDAHNVLVNEESGYLYTAIPNSPSAGGLSMYSLADPVNPVLVGTWSDSPDVHCHDAQVVSYTSGVNAGREIAFCFGEDDGLKIADVTVKSAPFTISTLTYPGLVYTHQGWLSDDKRFLFFGDELDELFDTVARTATYVVNVTDLANPSMATTFLSDGCWVDHNMMTRGGRLYQAQYSAGLRVLDVGHPTGLSEVAYFDTRPEDNQAGFPGAWGVYSQYQSRVITLSDRQRGLFVLLDQPERPVAHITSDVATTNVVDLVTFTGGSALPIPEASAITSWEWDFDYDGVSFDVDATGQQVQRGFLASGVNRVGLRVTDSEGDQDLATHEVLVVGSVPSVSQWGLAAMAIALVCAGTILLRRSRAGAVLRRS